MILNRKSNKKSTNKTMSSNEREVLQDILVEYIENPRKMGTCIKDIELLFREVHNRWKSESKQQPMSDEDMYNIISKVCSRYNITYNDLIGTKRSKHLITAREQICDALHSAGYNYSQIGRGINRHASTVIHTIRKLEE